jgi:alpha-1,3-rhamnosyltransferase
MTPAFISLSDPVLVSVVVITYQSAPYVLDTLDSIAGQTYSPIELVISDDGSRDNTVELCSEWLARHQERFIATAIITSPTNTGIPTNCNRGVQAANGTWIKLIAGDDLLHPTCIADNLAAVLPLAEPVIALSDMKVFEDGTDPDSSQEELKPPRSSLWSVHLGAHQQYKELLTDFCGNTPSFFIHASILRTVPYDERFPILEDYPFVLNATMAGFRLFYFSKQTVIYRRRAGSAFFGSKDRLFGDFYKKRLPFDLEYRYPYLPKQRVNYEMFYYRRNLWFEDLGLTRRTIVNRVLYRLSEYLNPYYLPLKLQARKTER